jgi:hypothetical protein
LGQLLEEWLSNFLSQKEDKKKVYYIYLINEVFSKLRGYKKDTQFDRFFGYIMTAMKDANNKIAETFKQEMSKILNVWQKQRFFIESKINDLKLELT